jgi:D-sedoheptulose 7-phosphate isomerase
MKGWKAALAAHNGVMGHVADLLEVHYEPAVQLLLTCIRSGGKILACGNGGSAVHAQHFAAELVVRYRYDRAALPAIALTADAAIMTAAGNDFGYDTVFERQVEAYGLYGDLLLAISTSGNSKNVLAAINRAQLKGMPILALSGINGMRAACTVDLNVPSIDTARIQEAHTLLIHVLVEGLEEKLYGTA